MRTGILLLSLLFSAPSAMHAQIAQVDIEAVEKMIASGEPDRVISFLQFVDPSWATTDEATTLVSTATEHGQLSVVEALLTLGANISTIDSEGRTPLIAAVQSGREDVALRLIELGADPKITPPGSDTVLRMARTSGLLDLVAKLDVPVSATAPAPAPGDTAHRMYNAILAGDLQTLSLLLADDADPNARPEGARPLLHTAVITGSLQAVDALLNAGADRNTLHEGRNAAQVAQQLEYWDIAAALDEELQNGATYALLDAISHADYDEVGRLLDQGTNPNSQSPDGRTPLLEAVLVGDRAVISRLLEAGSDPNASSEDGTSPLMLAILANDPSLIKELVLFGANPDAKIDGVPLISFAVMIGEEAAGQLWESGANPDVSDADGISPADLAWTLKNYSLAAMLGGSSLGKPAPMALIDAIGVMDAEAIREALKQESPNQVTPEGIPYLHVLVSNANDPEVVKVFVDDPRTDLKMLDNQGHTLHDVRIARQGSDENATDVIRAVFDSKNYNQSVFEFWLAQVGPDGRSGANKFVMTSSSQQIFSEQHLIQFGGIQDETGATPLMTAVVLGKDVLVERFVDAGVSTDGYNPTLQEIARSREDWEVLAALPYDRTPPEGFHKGASSEIKKRMQRRLRDWGYYTGEIDGVLGSGSRAAMAAYLKDVEAELKKMFQPSTDLRTRDVDFGDTYFFLSTRPEESWCWWKINYWHTEKNDGQTSSAKFVGCVKGEPEWNSTGVALVTWDDGKEEPRFFGSSGWEDDIPVR